jgi:hypothetical protein
VGFVVDRVALGHVFSECFSVPCQFSFHQMRHAHLSSSTGTVSQLVADVLSELHPPPPPPKKKNFLLVYSKGHYLKDGCAFIGFEILTAVVMKSSIFCDIMLCSRLTFNFAVLGTACHLLSHWFLAWLILRP